MNESIDPLSENPITKNYSAGYLHHLFNAKEMLGGMLLSLHNIYFYQDMMREIRDSIKNNKFQIFSNEFKKRYNS